MREAHGLVDARRDRLNRRFVSSIEDVRLRAGRCSHLDVREPFCSELPCCAIRRRE